MSADTSIPKRAEEPRVYAALEKKRLDGVTNDTLRRLGDYVAPMWKVDFDIHIHGALAKAYHAGLIDGFAQGVAAEAERNGAA